MSEAVPLEPLVAAAACGAIGSLFAAVEASFAALAGPRLPALYEESDAPTRRALDRYLVDPTRLHSRWLAGRVVSISLTAVLIASWAAPKVPAWAAILVGPLGALVTYGVLAELAIVLARPRAEQWAPWLVMVIRPVEWVMIPAAAPLVALGQAAARLFDPPAPDPRLVETEVEWAVTEGERSGTIGQEPAEMIRNVLELKDLVVREVMVPRTRVCAIDDVTPLADVLRRVATEGHSRYPVYRGTIDNVVGLLYAKDLFRVVRDGALATTRLSDLVRAPVNFVPESQSVSSVLREMRGRRLHMAIVIDEYGGVSGLVTLEDVLEEIVGDIRDEYDTDEAPIVDLGGGRWLADAAVSLNDLAAMLGVEIAVDGDYDSIGGLVTSEAGRVPPEGTEVLAFGLRFLVRESDPKRIVKVEISRAKVAAERDTAVTESGSVVVPTGDGERPGRRAASAN